MNINFPTDHDNPTDCQLIIALTGSRNEIEARLGKILEEFGKFGKPLQGTSMGYGTVFGKGGSKTVYTPVWNGKEY